MDSKKMSIIALVCAGVSIVFCWIPLIGLAAGVVGLIFSIKIMKAVKEEGADVPKWMYIVALACSIAGLVFSLICGTCVGCICIAAIAGGANGSFS